MRKSLALTCLALFVYIFMFGASVLEAAKKPSFEPVYKIIEVDDISIAGTKRFTVRVVVPDGLDEETLSKNVIHAAEKIMNERKAKAVTVWAYSESDEVKQAYSAAMCTLAPFGDISRATDPKATAKDMKAVVKFDDSYFEPVTSEIVDRIDEATRKEIFKAQINVERRSRKDAMRIMIKKYTKKTQKENASETELINMMNDVYSVGGTFQEEGSLGNELEEKYKEEVKSKYELSNDEYEKIGLEGLLNNWSMD